MGTTDLLDAIEKRQAAPRRLPARHRAEELGRRALLLEQRLSTIVADAMRRFRASVD